jgi:hypothetical protein
MKMYTLLRPDTVTLNFNLRFDSFRYEEEGARCILQHLFDDSKCAALYEGGSRAKGKALLERSKQAVSAVGGARRYISRIERRLQVCVMTYFSLYSVYFQYIFSV